MKTIIYNKKVLKIYDSIDEMPIVNFQKYNKYLLIDSGVGSDADDIDNHIISLAKLIKAKDTKKAMQELQNMRQNIYMVNNEISPKYLAFTALIHSIDGKEVTDLSDENLKQILQDLNKVKHSSLVNLLMWIKKKVSTELETYFPSNFTDAREKEVYDKIKARTLLILDSIVTDSDNAEQIDTIDQYMLSIYKPKVYDGTESVEIRYDKQFESSCMLISQKTNMDARKMTVLQFYSALDNIKKQLDAEAKAYKHVKK